MTTDPDARDLRRAAAIVLAVMAVAGVVYGAWVWVTS